MTTFADDFNRADSTNLGAGWVEVSGDWSIASNQLSPGNAGGTILLRASADAATDDNFTEATIAATAAASQGFVCRGNANFTSGYLWRNNGTSWDLFSIVGGSFTSLATYAAAAAPGDVARVQAVGSAIKAYVNGVERASVTNTDVATGKSSGIRAESTNALRFDNFSSGDVGGATVNATMALDGGAGTATATAKRTVYATVAAAGGAGAVALTGKRTVPGTAALTGGTPTLTAAGARTVHATGQLSGAAGVLAMSGSTGGLLKHASAVIVARAWLETIADIPEVGGRKQVATTLPPLAKWADTGFVTVGPIFPGTPEAYVPLQHPVVQFDCWAAHPHSKKPHDGLANELAEVIRAAADANMWEPPPVLTLPSDVRPVWLSSTTVVSGVVRVPDENYAHYSLDVHIGWIERDALAGVAG